MSDFKSIIKVLEKFGYPSNQFHDLCRLTGYYPDDFLSDMVENFGEDKTMEFVDRTFEKLNTKGKGIFIPLWNPNEYVHLIIENINVDLDEGNCVYIDWTWGDNQLLDDNGKLTTLAEIDEDNDPWDLDDFYDGIKEIVGDHIYNLTGFPICWGI